ncbi:MAG TPA: ABC transporter permease [Solimonas sp.]|nr:ABC transporter permease [Solimonas sp.]
MASVIQQIGAVTRMNLATVPARLGTSLVIVVGIAGVVGVMVALLAMAAGFKQTLASTGRADRALVLRAGSLDELGSILGVEQARLVMEAPGIRRDQGGNPLAVGEKYVLTDVVKRGTGSPANVVVRGTLPEVTRIRPEFRIVEGRMFRTGLREVVVGRGAHDQFSGVNIGDGVDVRDGPWTVVGTFTTGGDVHESELWVDDSALRDAMRSAYFSTVVLQLEDATPATLQKLKDHLTQDPRLAVSVQREPDYYASRSQALNGFITGLGYAVAVIMGIGALFGALNTMYAAVSSRTVEIATLRAIGFGGLPVVVSVLVESMILALVGGVVGAAIAYLVFNGYSVATMNFQTFSQVAFDFKVTPALLQQALVWSCLLGALGGLFPAIRAARLPIVDALRAQ